ncbi:MAG: hypothetical protein M1835_003306 [Candelina submexicana]|nr:MAG: hypothetical protein M1835_003306 [Candelina submexicana]
MAASISNPQEIYPPNLHQRAERSFSENCDDQTKEAFTFGKAVTGRIQNLEWYNSQYAAALQHAGLSSQADRRALNKTQDQLVNAQSLLSELEKALAKEQLQHRETQKDLQLERQRREYDNQHAACIQKTHEQRERIMNEIGQSKLIEMKKQILSELDNSLNSNIVALQSKLDDEMQISEEKEFRLGELYAIRDGDREKISSMKKIMERHSQQSQEDLHNDEKLHLCKKRKQESDESGKIKREFP